MKNIVSIWMLVAVSAVVWLPGAHAQSKTVHSSTFLGQGRTHLKKRTQRALPLAVAEETAEPPIVESEIDRGTATSPVDLKRRRIEKHQKYSELQERLQLLIREWQAEKEKRLAEHSEMQDPVQRATEQPAHSETVGADETAVTIPVDVSLKQVSETPPIPVPDEQSKVTPEVAKSDSAAEALDQSLRNSGSASDQEIPGKVLVDGPVDRIAFADNLYASGEFALAQEVYEQVDMKMQSPEQQYWVQFQNAMCFRAMGNRVKAKTQLRKLGSQADAGWLAHSAVWWLDMIDDRVELEQQISATQDQLNSRRKVADASSTR